MIILTIRTDKPEAEIGLFENNNELAHEKWLAHKHLSETIHLIIEKLLKSQPKNWNDIQAIVCFQGPGSFTGLRIGLAVGNALAYSLNVPVVGTDGKNWIQKGQKLLASGKNELVVIPEYGREARITVPRK